MLEYVQPEKLTEQDLRWIAHGAALSKGVPVDAQMLIAKALEGKAGIYRIAVGGVLVTSVKDDEELWIELVAGKGLVPRAKEINAAVRQLAAGMGLSRIAGYVGDRALARVYRTVLGLRPKAALFVEDL